MKEPTFQLKNTDTLEGIELLCNIVSLAIPPFAIGSIIFGAINKSYSQDNINRIVDKLNELSSRIEKIEKKTDKEIRNFTFEIYNSLKAAANEKYQEKVDYYADLIVNGINSNTIFETNDSYNWYLEILSRLSLNEINILEKICNASIEIKDTVCIIRKIPEENIKGTYYVGGKYKNFYHFGQKDYYSLDKLVSLGLLDKSFKSENDYIDRMPMELNIKPYYRLTQKYLDFLTSLGISKFKDLTLIFSDY